MATTTSTIANRANEVSKSSTAKAAKQADKTQRVLETRDQWAVIFNHTVSLVATLAKGEALPTEPRKGFAFGGPKEQPHSRGYAQSLLAGFTSKKAGKVFAQTEGLKEQADREKIALAILLKTKLGGDNETKARSILGKAEAKQARAFAEAVLNVVQAVSVPTEVAPTEQEAAPKAKRTKGTRKASSK